jgi:hypothetical protein
LTLQSDGSFLGFHSKPSDTRVDWKARARALWTLLANVGLGASRAQQSGDRALLVGHPLGDLAKLDPGTVVDQAEAHVRSLFPGAAATQSSALEIEVLSSHPWFGSATLSWENAENAELSELKLWHPPGSDQLTDTGKIVRCLQPVLGKPEESITDHLKKERSYLWPGTDYWKDGANMGGNNVWFRMPGGSKSKRRLAAIVSALDACAPSD